MPSRPSLTANIIPLSTYYLQVPAVPLPTEVDPVTGRPRKTELQLATVHVRGSVSTDSYSSPTVLVTP